MSASAPFTSNIALLDEHIDTIMDYCDADYAQVSLVALGVFGFILSHAGMKQTSLMVLDFSISGSGKTHNIDLQYKALLRPIINEQRDLQMSANDGEEKNKRYMNVHRNKVTPPALFDSLKTVPAQLLIFDELGLRLNTNDEIIQTLTELYGLEEAMLPVIKTEAPSVLSVVPTALNFIGATTLRYFGSKTKLRHHLLGGFVNRALIVYNNRLKTPDEIKPIGMNDMEVSHINNEIVQLLAFLRQNSLKVTFGDDSSQLILNLQREIQCTKSTFSQEGNEQFNDFYNRIVQNTLIIARIFHALKCFENDYWEETIDPLTTESAITYVKLVLYPQIDKLIDYLIDKPKLAQEERQLERIKYLVEEFLEKNGTMPKIREIQNRTHYSKDLLLKRVKGYLEVQAGTTILRYCVSDK